MGAYTVLVVDDDRDGCALLSELLRTNGYQVLEAWDGLDGLEQLHEQRSAVDLVILDLEMPNIDGAGFREQQLQRPSLQGVPVIVASGHPHAATIGKGVGAVTVISKPFTASAILEVVADTLAARASPAT